MPLRTLPARTSPVRTLPAALAFTLMLATPALAEWQRFSEPDGASLAVPRHVFDAPVARDETGTVFSDRSGELELVMFSWDNDADHTLRTIADDLRATMRGRRDVTYERVGRGFMVQSGLTREGDIFYERTEPSADGSRFVTMRLVYPPSRRGDVDRHIKRIGLSLKGPR